MSTDYNVYLGPYLKCSPANSDLAWDFIEECHERLTTANTEYMDKEYKKSDYFLPNVNFPLECERDLHFDPKIDNLVLDIYPNSQPPRETEDFCAFFAKEIMMLRERYTYVESSWGLVMYAN